MEISVKTEINFIQNVLLCTHAPIYVCVWGADIMCKMPCDFRDMSGQWTKDTAIAIMEAVDEFQERSAGDNSTIKFI